MRCRITTAAARRRGCIKVTKDISMNRSILTPKSSIGVLGVFGHSVYTLEDTKRAQKVAGETRIPAGRYPLELRNQGGMNDRYHRRFPRMHRGMIWLRHVPDFEWIYIHILNIPDETLGCIGVGLSYGVDRINNSTTAYLRIYPLIAEAIENGGCSIIIEDGD